MIRFLLDTWLVLKEFYWGPVWVVNSIGSDIGPCVGVGAAVCFIAALVAYVIIEDSKAGFRAKCGQVVLCTAALGVLAAFFLHVAGVVAMLAVVVGIFAWLLWLVGSFFRSLRYDRWTPIGEPAPREEREEGPTEMIAAHKPATEMIAEKREAMG